MHGCNGRMGQVITEMIAKEAEMEIVAGVDLSDHIQNSYPVFKSMKDCNVEADVVIDFANAKAVDGLLDVCVERNLPCVLCTTGLSEEQLAHVKEASGKVAILRSANMSMGINLLMKLLKDAVPVLAAAGYDMEMGITTTIECNVLVPGETVLDAKLLGSMVSRMPAGDICIELTDEGQAKISGGVAEFEIPALHARD